MTDIRGQVRRFIGGELGRDVTSVGDDDSLLESGVIDSLGVVRLVGFLEATYGIKVQEDDMMPENFDTVSAIVGFVRGRTATHG